MKTNILFKNLKSLYCLIFVITLLVPGPLLSQVNMQPVKPDRDLLINASMELMTSIRFCALITLDKTGHPQARTMEPFLPDSNMVVWMGTNSKSRKVKEIKSNPKAILYYEDPDGMGYVVIKGKAFLNNDQEMKSKYWRAEWEAFYPDKENTYILIKVIPESLEIVYYEKGITGDLITWEVPAVDFKSMK